MIRVGDSVEVRGENKEVRRFSFSHLVRIVI